MHTMTFVLLVGLGAVVYIALLSALIIVLEKLYRRLE